VSTNLGFDYMYGNIDTTFKAENVKSVSLTLYPGATANAVYETKGSIKWNMFSVTPEIFTYLDFIYFFSIYTGPSVSINTGSYDVSMRGSGVLQSNLGAGITDIGNLYVRTSEKLKPSILIPKWTLGIEINLWVVKIDIEASTVLTSAIKDSAMAQVGVRVQI
jgi:hypothetical protein